MPNILNYISLKTILNDYAMLKKDIATVGEDVIMQWASDALDRLNINKTLDYQVMLLDVSNYSTELPKGLVAVVQIAYNQNDVSNCSNLLPVVKEAVVGLCDDCEVVATYETVCPNGGCEPTVCQTNVPLLTVTGSNVSQIAPWIGYSRVVATSADYTDPRTKTWQPLRLCNNSFHNLQYHIKDCVNVELLNSSVNQTYETNRQSFGAYNARTELIPCYTIRDNRILTELKDTQLLIAYLTKKIDEEGYPMLPEDIHIIDAVMSYIEEKLAQKDYAAVKDNANRQYFMDMKQIRSLAFAQAINKYNMLSTEELENLGRMLRQIIPNTNAYSKFFN